MQLLQSDEKICSMCGNCSKLLTGFKTKYGGKLYVSELRLKEEEVMASVEKVIRECPTGAITLEPLACLPDKCYFPIQNF